MYIIIELGGLHQISAQTSRILLQQVPDRSQVKDDWIFDECKSVNGTIELKLLIRSGAHKADLFKG